MDFSVILEYKIFFYISLFIFGVMFGSFSSVLIARWKTGESGIWTGRSHCPKCQNILGSKELIPIFSYLFQKWKCRHCKAHIPIIYPILELVMGLVFVWMGHISVVIFENPLFSPAFFFLLFFGFITTIYVFYDILYTEIPEQVYVLFVLIFAVLWIFANFFQNIFYDFPMYEYRLTKYFLDKFFASIILYTFLFLQILIPASIFFAKKNQYKNIFEIFLWYFLFPFVTIFNFFKKFFGFKVVESEENDEEIPIWVGPGDLFLAIIIGLTLGLYGGIFAFFLAYVFGSIYAIFAMIFSDKNSKSMIPFGPFLGLGSLVALYFLPNIHIFVMEYQALFL